MNTAGSTHTTAYAARTTGVPFAHLISGDARQFSFVAKYLSERIERPGVQLEVAGLASAESPGIAEKHRTAKRSVMGARPCRTFQVC